MSSRTKRRNRLHISETRAFRSTTLGCRSCIRQKASNCRVREAARSAAFTICTPFFFFNSTATTELYTLSLHDALPISSLTARLWEVRPASPCDRLRCDRQAGDRKSTRLNSSHSSMSYDVFCLKKKNDLRPRLLDIFIETEKEMHNNASPS